MTNLISSLHFEDHYYKINREERNIAALLYHLLLQGNNLEIFLDKIQSFDKDNVLEFKKEEYGVYYEYAFVRDLWKYIEKDKKIIEANQSKFNFIYNFLKEVLNINAPFCDLNNPESIKTFNSMFCTTTAASKKHIVSPSNWNVGVIHEKFSKREFIKLCKFKWCFNAKPDLVIQLSGNSAICIEAKWESKEGTYPSSSSEKLFFNKTYIGQLEIQKMLMEKVLGITNVCYVYITKSGFENNSTDEDIIELSWFDAFDKLKNNNSIEFEHQWIDHIKKDSLEAKKKKQK